MAFAQSPTILLVKKLPPDLTESEATDLLQYFGAKSVSIMSPKGHMKGSAFAEFNSYEEADIALKKLHQVPIFGSRLIVQYSDRNYMPVEPPYPMVKLHPPKPPDIPTTANSSDGCSFKPDSSLHYLYPPPTPHTLSNISHALVAVPQFYIQVLHLMNKMNLPPPFLQSSEKSIFEQTESHPPPLPSSSESELESEGETVGESDKLEKEKEILEEKRIATQAFLDTHLPDDRKRKRELSQGHIAQKSIKIVEQLNTRDVHKQTQQGDITETVDMDIISDTEDVDVLTLESVQHLGINIDISNIQLPSDTPTSSEFFEQSTKKSSPSGPSTIPVPSQDSKSTEDTDPICLSKSITHGSQLPVSTKVTVSAIKSDHYSDPTSVERPTTSPKSEDPEHSKTLATEFEVYRKSVKTKCLDSDKLSELSVFKKYVQGAPSPKLYIKNLNHKSVTEKDITQIFEPYFHFHNSDGTSSKLEIKLMTRGQMKGQAFVTLPNVTAAENALEDLHGYVLFDKPMAIMFAKSK